ncbi:MAG: ABC transporter substrate-binding protein [Acetobacteraceae bacterium]|nr:ABC transporter substrate-binding protein [Acetobacteraceae bacterium]
MKLRLSAYAAAAMLAATPAFGADPVKIGLLTTLSGPNAALGIDIRDAFQLAIKQEGGKLGGVAVNVIVEDDELKPDVAKEIATRMVKRDNVSIMTGIVFSNVAMAVVPGIVRDGIFFISANAGPSQLAGQGCHTNYFNVAWQNDNLHEAAGQYVQTKGYQNVYILAPNYPAGKDALTGFKRFYKGKLAGEVYTQLGQTDYAAEIATLRAANPDAVFYFLPGGLGVAFIKQFDQAGLKGRVPVVGPGFSFSQDVLGATGDSALGVINTSQWNKDIDNPANKSFVAAFQATYGRLPTLYASQGYDAARLIASALKKAGDPKNTDQFRAALRAADFQSVRGAFKFGANNHPIQDIHVREVVKENGVLTNKIISVAFRQHQDAYVSQCKM